MKGFCEQHGGRSRLAFVLILGFVIFHGRIASVRAADVDVCSARLLVDCVLSKRECPLLPPLKPVEILNFVIHIGVQLGIIVGLVMLSACSRSCRDLDVVTGVDANANLPCSPPAKDGIPSTQTPVKKPARQWAAWIHQEESFFNALRQVGKNFEKITSRVQSKNKDQD